MAWEIQWDKNSLRLGEHLGEVFLCTCLVLPHPLAPICGRSGSSWSCFTEVPAGSSCLHQTFVLAARAPSGCRDRLWLVSLWCCQLLESLDLPECCEVPLPHNTSASLLLALLLLSIFLQIWAHHPLSTGCPAPGHGRQGKLRHSVF